MPDYLALGHITVDLLPYGRSIVGGSVAYAATTAARLGLSAGTVTSAGEEMDWSAELPGVEIVRSPALESTTFENRYKDGQRFQKVVATAGPVVAEIVPSTWTDSAIVHLAPVVHELAGDLPGLFQGSLIGLTPQGLLREWGGRGRVRQARWHGDDRLLAGSRAVILSMEDLAADPDFLARCRALVPVTILTQGAQGAILYLDGEEKSFPAFPTAEVDPTGAGDVFAAAFLIEYRRTGDPLRSTAFACCAASFSVEQSGLTGVPNREMVERRLKQYQS